MKILLVGKGYWGNVWYKTLFKNFIDFSVVDKVLVHGKDSNGINNYNNLDDALCKEEFTHAIIATPSENHVEVYNRIYSFHINPQNILVEKPCGMSAIDFYDYDDFFPGYLFLYCEPYKYIKSHLSDIGIPIMYKSIRASMGPQPRTDISIVADYLIHDLYLFADLFGFDDIEVLNSIPQKHFIHSNKPDTISTQLYNLTDKSTGVIGDMFSSWWYPYKQREVIISGDKGTFLWSNDKLKYFENAYRKTNNIDKNRNYRYELFHSNSEDIILTEKMTVDSELEHFLAGHKYPIRPSQVWKLINNIENYE